jgi:hypothetical protein
LYGGVPAPQHGDREEREHGRRKVSMGGGLRERSRQVRRDHTRYEKRQPDESKGVQEEQGSKRLSTWSIPERGPDVSRDDHSSHGEGQEHTDPEYPRGYIIGSAPVRQRAGTPTCRRKIATTTAAVNLRTSTASRFVDTQATYGRCPARAVKVP